MTTLITGVAGFIGFHKALYELRKGKRVIGIDNLNDYYDPKLKNSRLNILKKNKNFLFLKKDLSKNNCYHSLKKYFNQIECVIHLAGQAGVRYSITNPEEYIKHNIVAYVKLLEFFKNSTSSKL